MPSCRSLSARRAAVLAFAAAIAPVAGAVEDTPWHALAVPDSWKTPPRGELEPLDGFCWYRCRVAVPTAWAGRPLELFVEPVDDARQVFVNGSLIGAAGTFPPRYRSGLGEPSRHAVPGGLAPAGKTALVAIRIYTSDSRTNFSVSAPVLLAGDEAIRLEGAWQYRPGDNPAWARDEGERAADGEREPFSRVERVDDLETFVRRRRGDRDALAPAEALARFTIADDLAVDLVLSEPEIAQPLFLSFDERDRLWVLEYRQYPDPAGLAVVSRDRHLRTVYDGVPAPPPGHVRGRDRISIHEDTDGDGAFDRHSVFVDGLNIATSFARGRGGVWVLNPPYLLFYRDADGDDVPDGDPEVHLEGFGLEDSHSVVNNLRWGPDGWLYAAQGSTVSGRVRRPGDTQPEVVSMGQLIWRYHPESRRYEIFAEGGGNAFGVEIDSRGRIFSGTNGGDSRGFHYVQGGYSRKSFEKHGALSNPYAFGHFEDMEHDRVPRFTHTFVIYEDEALPERYRGKLLGVEPLQGQIVLSEIERDRSSFRTRDITRPLTTDDQWFRPVDIRVGPDGAIWVADFYEQRIDHSSHYAGRVDRDSGRVYRIRAKDARPHRPVDLRRMSGRQLVEILASGKRTHRQTALRLIADRRDAALVEPLLELARSTTGQSALEALWALGATSALTGDVALEMLDHADPFVRLWTARLLCDARRVTAAVSRKLVEVASREPVVDVRSQLASSARRLPLADALPLVRALLAHDEDADDIHVPLLLWWALEAKIGEDRDAALALFDDPQLWSRPLVERHLLERTARRLAATGVRTDLIALAALLRDAPETPHREALLRGLELGSRGRSLADLPDELADVLAGAGGGPPALRLRRGDPGEVKKALEIIADSAAPRERRLDLIRVLAQVPRSGNAPALLDVVRGATDTELRIAALAALGALDAPSIASAILAMTASLPAEVRDAALDILATRAAWARRLLEACAAGEIDPDSVPRRVVRRALVHGDRRVEELVEDHFGDVDSAAAGAVRERIARIHRILGEGSGNPYRGETLFRERCGRCHEMFGDGGGVGPDLTPYDRGNLERLLLNVVDPGVEIREGYENYLILTRDGRALSGFLADQDPLVVVLRGVDGQNIVLQRTSIRDMRAAPTPIMPEDTLDGLDDQGVRDLFAFLRSSQPLP